MSLSCLNTTTIADASVQLVEETQSVIYWLYEGTILTASLATNGWLLTVSWGNKHIDGIFKYPLCNLAFCDVLMTVTHWAQTTLLVWLPPRVYLRICGAAYVLVVGGVLVMCSALMLTPLQRCVVFVNAPPTLAAYMTQPRSFLRVCAALLSVSYVLAVGSVLGPADQCLRSSPCPDLPVNSSLTDLRRGLFVVSFGVAILCLFLFVRKVKQMDAVAKTARATLQSTSELKVNRDVLAMAVIQTINPILLTSPIVIVRAIDRLFNLQNTGMLAAIRMAATGLFTLNPVFDALSAVYFIKPYRRLALKMLKRVHQKLWPTAKSTVVAVQPAADIQMAPTPKVD